MSLTGHEEMSHFVVSGHGGDVQGGNVHAVLPRCVGNYRNWRRQLADAAFSRTSTQ